MHDLFCEEGGRPEIITYINVTYSQLVRLSKTVRVSIKGLTEKQIQNQTVKAGEGRQLCKWNVLDQGHGFTKNENA